VRSDRRVLVGHLWRLRAYKWAPGVGIGWAALVDAGVPGWML
jgi:hypothetical protein